MKLLLIFLIIVSAALGTLRLTETYSDAPYDHTSWDSVMPYSTDISYVDSPHPLHNSPAYGDTPQEIQCILNDKLNAPGAAGFKSVLNNVVWFPNPQKKYSRDVVEGTLETFLKTSGLQSKGYYIVMSKLLTYDHNASNTTILLRIKTCIYKPGTFSAKVVEFDCACFAKQRDHMYTYYFHDASVTGIIQEAFINKDAHRRWTA